MITIPGKPYDLIPFVSQNKIYLLSHMRFLAKNYFQKNFDRGMGNYFTSQKTYGKLCLLKNTM